MVELAKDEANNEIYDNEATACPARNLPLRPYTAGEKKGSYDSCATNAQIKLWGKVG